MLHHQLATSPHFETGLFGQSNSWFEREDRSDSPDCDNYKDYDDVDCYVVVVHIVFYYQRDKISFESQ